MSVYPPRHELLDTRLRRFTRRLHGVEARDIDAVHRTRVASRRLRELLPVLLLEPPTVHKLNRKMRRVTRTLGPVRELDVLGLLIDELHDSRRYPERALSRLTAEVATARQRANAKMSTVDIGRELRAASRKLERLLEALKLQGTTPAQSRGVRWAIDARVSRRAARLKTAMAEAGSVYLAERLHAVRIATKKLRYGLELAAEAAGASRRADLGILKRAQELLGRMHDLQVLIDLARQVQGDLKPPDVIAWRELDAVIAGLETSCRRLHARYVHDRAGLSSLCDRLTTPAARRATAKAG
jgi:CHAD domain-containing protein